MTDNKNWTTDDKQIKSSGLYKFVEGATAKEKILNVTHNKRED